MSKECPDEDSSEGERESGFRHFVTVSIGWARHEWKKSVLNERVNIVSALVMAALTCIYVFATLIYVVTSIVNVVQTNRQVLLTQQSQTGVLSIENFEPYRDIRTNPSISFSIFNRGNSIVRRINLALDVFNEPINSSNAPKSWDEVKQQMQAASRLDPNGESLAPGQSPITRDIPIYYPDDVYHHKRELSFWIVVTYLDIFGKVKSESRCYYYSTHAINGKMAECPLN